LTHVFVPYGAIDMEGCARDYDSTAAINVSSVIRVLEDSLAAGLVPVFISTDYVFDGSRGLWTEGDEPRPRMAYGAQKLEVEHWLAGQPGSWLITRLSKIVSGDTLTHSMLGQWVNELRGGRSFRCADDQIFSPAWVDDLAGALIRLADVEATGLFHVAGPAAFSRIDLLRLLVREVQAVDPLVRAEITPCGLHDLPFLEKRPLDTSLAIDKLQACIGWRFKPMEVLCREIAQEHFGQ
jgi:dTDP-4-dehydrorhamnose reductase